MVRKENIVLTKTYNFSVRIDPIIWDIQKTQREFVLSNQRYRSATSIGARTEEAIEGFFRNDFKAKLILAYKEARQSEYW